MLSIHQLSMEFAQEPLFSNLSLEVIRGEIACIAGESGKGKTSLLNAIMGFRGVKEGSIQVDGVTLSEETIFSIRRKIAWMPQELSLPTEWVHQMVHLPFELRNNRKGHFSEEKLFACFDELGLERELYKKRVTEISGGQRQRIMLSVCSLLDRPLLIVDEPTSALDSVSTDRVLSFFRLLSKRGTAILTVSHDEQFIAGCDQKILI